ncbi:NAD-dependent epimerase/dehydratase family protein [Planobispora longispora]|uniref:NAD-dependent epimerase/dehydratase family protein n=1 Tax=Planobispora longispora TaxID=28887 RepID=UPI0019414397|nr:NAD-dependent epimerase/dehydratase family protein [Planobispora longispora]
MTGAGGFIGSHLTRRLHLLGADVHAVSRHPRDSGYGEKWHPVDLCDAGATAALVETVRPEVVFHLAGEVNGARDPGIVAPTLHNNLGSTVNVLAAVTEIPGARVLLTGSSEEPRPGNGHAAPSSPYAMAKWAATGYAELFHRLWDAPVTVLRPTMVYGPAQRDASKVIPHVTLSLLAGRSPGLTSGTKLADWIYVDDVVDAFLTAAVADDTIGRVLDIGTGTKTSVRQVVELLFQIVGSPLRPRFGVIADRPGDIPQAADIALAADLLGWRPAVDLKDGLQRTVAWYAEHMSYEPL